MICQKKSKNLFSINNLLIEIKEILDSRNSLSFTEAEHITASLRDFAKIYRRNEKVYPVLMEIIYGIGDLQGIEKGARQISLQSPISDLEIQMSFL